MSKKFHFKISLTFFLVFISFLYTKAQDIIYRKNGKTIETKILELNPDEVKYKEFAQPNGATFTIDVALIKKIVFENGTVHNFDTKDNFSNTELYVGQKRSAYKINFLGPVFGYTTLTYERNIKPGNSFEGRLNIIGLGKQPNNYYSSSSSVKPNLFGLGFTGGYKFYHKPDYYSSRQRYAHLLKGGYIRPELTIASYKQNATFYTSSNIPPYTTSMTTQRVSTTYGCLLLAFGKQWIFDNIFAVDVSAGIGLGVISRSNSGGYGSDGIFGDSSNYGHTIAPNGLAMNLGFNIGFLGK